MTGFVAVKEIREVVKSDTVGGKYNLKKQRFTLT